MKIAASTSLKRFFLATSIFAVGVLLILIFAIRHLAFLARSSGEGVGIVISPSTIGTILAVLLVLAASSLWISRKLVR
jgi:hypothetical protein